MLCVIMTAYADLETAIEALKRGAYDYLRKPFDFQELTATLGRCFDKIRLEQANQRAQTALKDSEMRFLQAQKT